MSCETFEFEVSRSDSFDSEVLLCRCAFAQNYVGRRGKYLGCILRLGAHLGCHGSLLLVYLSVVCVIPPDLFIPSVPFLGPGLYLHEPSGRFARTNLHLMP